MSFHSTMHVMPSCAQRALLQKCVHMHHMRAVARLNPAAICMRRARGRVLRAEQSDSSASSPEPSQFGLAPAKAKTAYGEMLTYYLKMEPQLFHTAVEDQLDRLKAEKEQREEEERKLRENINPSDTELPALSRRMVEVRQAEIKATLEDLMYVSILEKFVRLGVEMLPRMDGYVDVDSLNLKPLTEGIHSKEALELVKEHLFAVMRIQALNSLNIPIKMAKFQMAQVYAASVMFGYFLRRVDRRFQLDKALGTLPTSPEDAVERLERLFSMADSMDESDDPDSATPIVEVQNPDRPEDSPRPSSEASSSSSSSRSSSSSSGFLQKKKSALREYVELFDQATVVEMARIVSQEGAAQVERQTSALFGDIKKLTQQMQEAVGVVTSMEEVMEKMEKAITDDKVETLTMTLGTQRRAVLEAVAFGAFMRDVETWVQEDYHLLTPLPLPPSASGGPPSMML